MAFRDLRQQQTRRHDPLALSFASMQITDIPVDGYERVAVCKDPITGLHALIAVHDTTLGPALGGMRMLPYAKVSINGQQLVSKQALLMTSQQNLLKHRFNRVGIGADKVGDAGPVRHAVAGQGLEDDVGGVSVGIGECDNCAFPFASYERIKEPSFQHLFQNRPLLY